MSEIKIITMNQHIPMSEKTGPLESVPCPQYANQEPTAAPQAGEPPRVVQNEPYEGARYTTIQTLDTGDQASLVVTSHRPSRQFDDYMTSSVLATIFCFWPVGIFAIWNSVLARNAWDRGDIAIAKSRANSAVKLINVALCVGFLTIILIVIGVIVNIYDVHEG